MTDSKRKKPKQIPFEDLLVDVWEPTLPHQPWLAMFRGLPMIFKGHSHYDAARKAFVWRKEEMAKEARKKANAKATSERMRKRAEP